MKSEFENMPTGEEICECCDCGRPFEHAGRHRSDDDDCGECHTCFKPLP